MYFGTNALLRVLLEHDWLARQSRAFNTRRTTTIRYYDMAAFSKFEHIYGATIYFVSYNQHGVLFQLEQGKFVLPSCKTAYNHEVVARNYANNVGFTDLFYIASRSFDGKMIHVYYCDISDEYSNTVRIHVSENKNLPYDYVTYDIIKSIENDMSPQVNEDKWIKDDWVSIPVFKEWYVKHRPGEQHKKLKSMLDILSDDWKSTYCRNSHDNFRWLIKVFLFHNISSDILRYRTYNERRQMNQEKYNRFRNDNISGDDFLPQVFENVTGRAITTMLESPQVMTTLTKVTCAADAITDLSTNASHTMDELKTTFDGIMKRCYEKVEGLSSSFDTMTSITSILRLIVSTFSYFALLSQKCMHNAANIIACTVLYLNGIVPSTLDLSILEKIKSNLILNVKGVIEQIHQGVKRRFTSSNTESTEEFIPQANEGTHYRGLVTTLFSLMKTSFCSFYKEVDFRSWELDVKTLDNHMKISRHIFGSKSLIDVCMSALNCIIDCASSFLKNKVGYTPTFISDELGKTFDNYLQFKRGNWKETARHDSDIANKLTTLHRDLYEKIAKLRNEMLADEFDKSSRESLKVKIMLQYLNEMSKEVTKVYETLPPHLKIAGKTKGRDKPFFIHIFGKPRIGKTSSIQPMIIAEVLRELNLVSKYESEDTTTFARNPDSEYWDGYHNQLVVTYNDAFQVNANKETIMSMINELTQVVDDNVLTLNMADVADKGQFYFNSPIVVMNSQDNICQKFIADKCWSNGDHLYNRRNIVFELMLNPKYAKQNEPGIDMRLFEQSRLNGEDQIGPFPADAYLFQFYSPNDRSRSTIQLFDRHGNELGKNGCVNFVEGMTYIISQARRHFRQHNDFKEAQAAFLANRFKKPLTQEGELWRPQGREEVTVFYSCDGEEGNVTIGEEDPEIAEFLEIVNRRLPDCQCRQIYSDAIEQGFGMDDPLIGIFLQRQGEHVCVTSYNELVNRTRFSLPSMVRMNKIQQFIAKLPTWKKNLSNLWNNHKGKILLGVLGAITVVLGLSTYFVMSRQDEEEADDDYEIESMEQLKAKQVRFHQLVRPKQQSMEALKKTTKYVQLMRPQPQHNEKNEQLERSLYNQYAIVKYYLQSRSDKDLRVEIDSMVHNWLCVGGNLFVIPNHYAVRITQIRDLLVDIDLIAEFSWSNIKKQTTLVDLSYMHFIKPEEVGLSYMNDISFVHVKGLPVSASYVNDFVSIKDKPLLDMAVLTGFNYCGQYKTRVLPGTRLITAPMSYDLEGTSPLIMAMEPCLRELPKTVTFHIPSHYRYSALTKAGDCGQVLMHCDDKLHAKILGIHVAGNGNAGMAVPVYREDLYAVIDYLEKKKIYNTTVCQANELYRPMNSEKEQRYTDFGFNVLGMTSEMTDMEGRSRNIRLTLPKKDVMRKTPLFDLMETSPVFGPHKQEPVRVQKFINEDGVEVSPYEIGVKKLTNYSKMIPKDMYDTIKTHMIETIRSWPCNAQKRKDILTDYEMVNGTDVLNQIDITTSGGFPFDFYKPGEKKKPWFEELVNPDGSKSYKPTKEMQEMLDERLEMAKRDMIKTTVFKDTLKVNETRPIDKVKAGKTRIFQVGPMDLVLLTRKYVGRFLELCHTTFIDGEISIGMNCESTDWDLAFKRMMKFKHFINGDYSNYDSTLPFWICEMICDVINEWYDDCEENKRIRRALLIACFAGYHISEDIVHFFRQGNPSGCSLTSEFNCLANMILIRYAYLKAFGTLVSFHDDICAKFYGDDNLVGVSDFASSKLNMITYETYMAELGITYTSTTKKDIKMPVVFQSDLSYLKRTFKNDAKYGLIALMDKDVIYNICRYCEGDISPTNLLNQADSTMNFMWSYGRTEFNKVRNELLRLNAQVEEAYRFDGSRLKSYDDITMDRYGPQVLDNDRIVQLINKLKQ